MYFNSKRHEKHFNELCAVYAQDNKRMQRVFYILSCDLMYKKIDKICDFENRFLNTDVLEEGWQTSGTRILTLSAFSLFEGDDEYNVNLSKVVGTLDTKNRNVLITALTI